MPSKKKNEKRGAHLRVPDHLKKEKKVYVPTGNPTGRKANPNTVKKVYVPTGKPRGRRPGQKNKPKELKE